MKRLCLSLELVGLREAAHVVLNRALVAEELDVGTVDTEVTSLALLHVLLARKRGEAPVLGDDDLLATRELVLATSESLDGSSAVSITSADRQKNLADVHTGDGTVGLTPGTTHTSLQSIGTSARQHLVDTDDVVRVGANTEVETFLSGDLDEVLVRADTGSLERLRAQLFIFVGDQVDAERELVDVGTLTAQVEDANLGVGYTTVEARLGVRLVLAVPVAASGTAGHFVGWSWV